MENDLKFIDDFFSDSLSETETQLFNNNIKNDAAFARKVAFYVQSKQLGKIEQKKRFTELNQELNDRKSNVSIWKNLGIFTAAASIILIGIWLFYGNNKITAEQYAQNYAKNNFAVISTEMSVNNDAISKGTDLYNHRKYNEALDIFNKIDDNPLSFEYQGLSYVQLQENSNALESFMKLAENKELLQNKGLFYQSLVLLKMGKTSEAKEILQRIGQEKNAFGKKEAEELLKLM